MATSCPDCLAEMKWRPPFYVCTVCGLSLRRHELERTRDKQKDDLWDERYGEKDEKTKRQKEMLDWYLSSKDD